MASTDPKTAERPSQGESKINTGGAIDRVQMASRHPDGSPNQTSGFEFVGDKESTLKAAKVQLSQQAVSNADQKIRREITEEETEEPALDENASKLQKAHEAASQAADKAADSEINSAFAKSEKA